MYSYNSVDSSGYIGKKIGYFKNGRLVPSFFDQNLLDTDRNSKNTISKNIASNGSTQPSLEKDSETDKKKITQDASPENLSISQKDRSRHLYVVGKTGMGKSTLLENLAIQDIYAGLGVCFIDPHGDSVEYILDKIPSSRHKDVIYFDPSDLDYPIGLNMLDGEDVEDYLVCSGMMSVFKRIWAGSWSSRMEYILNNTLLTLLEMHNSGFKKQLLKREENLENSSESLHSKPNYKNLSSKNIKNWLKSQNLNYSLAYNKIHINKFSDQNNLAHSAKNQYQNQNGEESEEQILEQNSNQYKVFTDSDTKIQTDEYSPNKSQNNFKHEKKPDSNKNTDQIWSQFDNSLSLDIKPLQDLSSQPQTLLGVIKLLSDTNYLKSIIPYIKNPILKHFWQKEYLNFNEKYRQEATSPILNKIGQFFSSSVIRGIVGQATSSFDFRKVMDESKILLVNLNKGKLGEDNTNILGSLIVTKIQIATMNRKKRDSFNLYVDEFQNFTTDSFASILSEARKYGLCLNLANQYVDQLSETGNQKIKNAIFGNIGSLIVFQVGYHDVKPLSLELGVQQDILTALQRGQFVARISNMNQEGVSIFDQKSGYANQDQNRSSPVKESDQKNLETMFYPSSSGEVVLGQSFGRVFYKFGGNSQIVRELSRQKYGRSRIATEKNIEQYLAESSDQENTGPQSSKKSKKKKKAT